MRLYEKTDTEISLGQLAVKLQIDNHRKSAPERHHCQQGYFWIFINLGTKEDYLQQQNSGKSG